MIRMLLNLAQLMCTLFHFAFVVSSYTLQMRRTVEQHSLSE